MNQSNLVSPPRNRALRRIVVRVACFVSTALMCASVASAQVPNERARSRVPADPRIAPDVVEQLRARPDVEIAAVGRHGTPSVLRGRLGRVNKPTASIRAADLAPVIADLAPVFRLRPADLESEKEWSDRLGHRHVRFRQRKHGLEVVGSSLSLHVNESGVVYAAFGNARDGSSAPTPARAVYDARGASGIARAEIGVRDTDEPELVYIVTSRDGEMFLAWRVRVAGTYAGTPIDADLFVDAISGQVVDRHPLIHSAKFRVVTKTAYGQPPDWDNYIQNGIQPPPGWPIVLYQYENLANPSQPIRGLTLPNGDLVWNVSSPNVDSVAIANWSALEVGYDYFNQAHLIDSYDKLGGHLVSGVNSNSSVNNASWSTVSKSMSFGIGDGVNSGPLAVDVDVVVHELAHGVTQFSSNLIYSYESGALNESFSDIMSVSAQWWKNPSITADALWKFGEASRTPGVSGDATRYLNDPHEDYGQNSNPDFYSRDFYADRYQGTGDAGGVHFNSGIPNLAFHLLSVGGTHPRGKTTMNVPGIGIGNAHRIFYKAFTDYLGPGAQMIDARSATVMAAQSIPGFAQYTSAVHCAWDAVGVPALQNNTHPINLSTRANVGTGDNIMIAGFVLEGAGNKQLLLRGIGPQLALPPFNLSGTLYDPVISLPGISGASNDNWGNASSAPTLVTVTQQLSGFPLANNSRDAAMLYTLPQGAYSLHLSGKNGGTGNALVEVYDAAPGNEPSLRNLSTRCLVSPATPAIAGVVVHGQAHKWLLVRAVGPTLGVSGKISDPALTLFIESTPVASNNNWPSGNPTIEAISADVGAFPLNAGSKDAVMLISVPPGAYTIHATSGDGVASGLCLLEIYDVPEMQ